MEVFLWNMVASYQLLFVVISSVIFIFIRDKSFKYYALYNLTLIIYILSRNEIIYHNFVGYIAQFLGPERALTFTIILSFFIQVCFYNLYVIFVMYFLDLHRHSKKYFAMIIKLVRFLTAFFFIAALVCYYYQNSDLYINLFSFILLPSLIALFIPSVTRVIDFSGAHKYYLIVGVFIFIICGLTALAGTYIPSLEITSPISYFYLGLIVETIFFSLALAYKVKIINDERARIRIAVTHHKYKQHISKIHGLIEGEEKEKNRIAEELHDGITGDLSAIRINLERLKYVDDNPQNVDIINDVIRIVDKSCLHIREISHNLSPHSITNYGLIASLEKICASLETLYAIKCTFTHVGDRLDTEVSTETHLYRIAQELLNNLVKHSHSKTAQVSISYFKPMLELKIIDTGKGFTFENLSRGIGFHNIESRVRILNGKFSKVETDIGSTFLIRINTDKIPDLKMQ